MNPRIYFRQRLALLVLLTAGLLAVFIALESRQSPPRLWTGQGGNARAGGLSPEVIEFVRQRQPVDVAVFADAASEVGRLVAAFLKPYQAMQIDGQAAVRVRFIDPLQNPGLVRMNQVRINGEMVLRLRALGHGNETGPRLHVQALEPELFLNTWWQLERAATGDLPPWILIAQGSGSREIDTESASGIGRWVDGLQRAGYRILARPLDQVGDFLEQVRLLILPAPVEDVPDSVLQAAQGHQVRLWWLTDPELARKQVALELTLTLLSVAEQPRATDNGEQLEESSALGLANFRPHAITEYMPGPVVMPGAVGFVPENSPAAGQGEMVWSPLLDNEKGQTVAWFNGKQAVTGDTDFISNTYLNQGANRVFARRVLDALLDQPHFVIPGTGAGHGRLLFTEPQLLAFSVLALFGVPLVFLLVALWQWRRVRRP